jgi:hypothetical protein
VAVEVGQVLAPAYVRVLIEDSDGGRGHGQGRHQRSCGAGAFLGERVKGVRP